MEMNWLEVFESIAWLIGVLIYAWFIHSEVKNER